MVYNFPRMRPRIAMTTTTADSSARTALRGLTRSQKVWGVLLAAGTAVGGLLLLTEDSPRSALTPPALVEVALPSAANSLSKVFQTKTPVEKGRWQGIVIHHSGSPIGSAESITRQHNARGFKGLGYHFVISNGQGAPDGQIFVGYRWQDQLPGVHVTGTRAESYNRATIGICLVGDGERREFTDAQLRRLVELVSTLQKELGINDQHVWLNREVSPASGPGRLFPEAAFRQLLAESR